MDATPEHYGCLSASWLDHAPGSPVHRSTPLPGLLYGRPGLAELSPAFVGSCSVGFILADSRPLLEARDTTFDRFGRCRPTRVLGLHATPLPLGGKVPPGRRPSCARILLQLPTDTIHRTFRLSIERFSSHRFRFDFHLPKLSPHGAQRHVGQVIGSTHHPSRILWSAYYPCCFSATELPGCHPPRISSRRTRLFTRPSDSLNVSRAPSPISGTVSFKTRGTSLRLSILSNRLTVLRSHEHPRFVGPTFHLSRGESSPAYSVCRLPLSLRSTGRRSYR